jgi:hypothetical protein
MGGCNRLHLRVHYGVSFSACRECKNTGACLSRDIVRDIAATVDGRSQMGVLPLFWLKNFFCNR